MVALHMCRGIFLLSASNIAGVFRVSRQTIRCFSLLEVRVVSTGVARPGLRRHTLYIGHSRATTTYRCDSSLEAPHRLYIVQCNDRVHVHSL